MKIVTENQSNQLVWYSQVAIILAVPILFYDTTLAMVNVWIVNETFTHGFLIFPISLWLLWQKRALLAGLKLTPEPRIFFLLIPILILWLLGYIADIQTVQQLCIVSLIPAITWLLLGRRILFSILFPLLFLFFAVPLGQGLIPPLMEFTANFTVFLITQVGIPIYRDGLFFILPTGNWSVVEECSGVRYLIASVALGALYAYISYSSISKRLIFIIASIIVPIVANGFRAFGIVMIGHFSDMELATGVDHLLYGWAFFGLIIFLMFYIGSYWSDPLTISDSKLEKSASDSQSVSRQTIKLLAIITLTLILFIKIFAYQVTHSQKRLPENFVLSLPDNLQGWSYLQGRSLNWTPELSAPDASLSRVYGLVGDLVQIDIGYYHAQRPGAEAITSQNQLTNPYNGEWKITYSANLEEMNRIFREAEIRYLDNKILVWQWFQSGSQQSPSLYTAKIFELYNRIVTNRTDAAFITVSTRLDESRDEARERLRDFLTSSSTDISLHLDSIRKITINE